MRIAGAWRISPAVFGDARGSFSEWFRSDLIEQATGFSFTTVQANISHSSRGVLRGIHFAEVPPGQAKFVMPVAGSIIDFVVDIRVGSPTFGQWDSATLDSAQHHAVMLEPGLGHAFVAMDDRTTVSYLVTDFYRPEREHGIDPFDSEIGLDFPDGVELLLSDKDSAAPSLAQARDAGVLPVWSER